MRTTNLKSMVVVAGSAASFALMGCSSESGNPTNNQTTGTSMTGGSTGGTTGSGGSTGGSTGGTTGGTGGTGAGGTTGGAGGSTGGAGGTTGGAGGSTGGAGGTTGGAGGSTGGTGGAGGATGGTGGATGGSGGSTGGAGGTTGGAGGSTGGAGGTGGTGGGGSGMTYDVTTGPVTLMPGEERIVCVDKKLPTTAAIDMVKITSELTAGGHHLVFYKSAATAEVTTPYTCQTFRDITTGTVPLYIAQKPMTVLNFPTGVAYTMPAAQMVRVELHFLNSTAAPLAVTGTVHSPRRRGLDHRTCEPHVLRQPQNRGPRPEHGHGRSDVPQVRLHGAENLRAHRTSASARHRRQHRARVGDDGHGHQRLYEYRLGRPAAHHLRSPAGASGRPGLPLHVHVQQPDQLAHHVRRRCEPGDVLPLGVLLPGHGIRYRLEPVTVVGVASAAESA